MARGPRRKKSKQFPGGAARSAPTPKPSSGTGPAQGMKPVAQKAHSGKPATPLLDSLPRAETTPPAGDGISRHVPREYRAQAPGRCQRQFIKSKDPQTSDLYLWIQEWVERVDRRSLFSSAGLHTVEIEIDWRLISNSGVDEGIIRPVIGAGGWPLIPGSSIKGLFRRVCPAARLQRWCGSPCQGGSGELSPGLLRFHGAWPMDVGWSNGLLDVAHPQQNWQVGFNNGRESHSAFGVVSLYRPRLQVGLSSTDPSLTAVEWQEIDRTLRQALQQGIGGRTCVGYGSSGAIDGDLIFQCGLIGQGPAAKLLDGTAEFRPTMFRAAIRGMALRLFAGLTDERTALQVVGELFGSLSREEGQNVGLLATSYNGSQNRLGKFGSGTWAQPVFATSGQLQWRQARCLRNGEDAELLVELLGLLHGLTMTLGGFGRGWRRPDHRIFLPSYYKSGRPKAPIGTHWQWLKPNELPKGLHVQSVDDLERLLRHSQSTARRWLAAVNRKQGKPAAWREVLAPDRVGIWLRQASDPEDACVVGWFHEAPEPDREGNKDPRDLKKTDIGGRVNQVGRIWNRLLPLYGEGGNSRTAPPPAQAPFARPSGPGGALARPPSPMARPAVSGAATARPSSGGGAATARSRPQQLGGPVSIDAWGGPYLESVVLFLDPRDRGHGPALRRVLDEGAGANFRRIRFTTT